MKKNHDKFDFSGHVTLLEDADSADAPTNGKTLMDSELEAAGLIKTSAFVRTKKSKNALRVAKHKEKKEIETGVKQLNIEVPAEHRDTIKALAKALVQGKAISKELLANLPTKSGEAKKEVKAPKKPLEEKNEVLSDECIKLGEKCAQIASEGGLKAILLKLIV